jgi:outer membrane protein TolC
MLLLALLFLLAASAPAQERLTLSMKQAVDLALAPDGSARLQLARELIRQSSTRAAQSRAALLPNADASVTAQNFTRNLRAFGLTIPIPGVPDVVGPITVYDWRGTLTQTIFDFSAIKRLEAARAGVNLAKAEEEAARNAVTDQVARVYLALVRSEESIAAAKANVELAASLLKLAVSQKDAGTGTGIEVTRAQVQSSNEQQRLLVTRNERDRAEIVLLRAIGLSMSVHVQASDALAYSATDPVTPDEAVKTARDTRADWRVQQRRETVSQLNASAVKWERLPSLAAFADAGGIGTEAFDPRFTRTVGVGLKLPIFDGGRRDARRSEAESQLAQEQIRGRDLMKQIEAEVRLALESLQSAEGQVKVADEGLALAGNELAQSRRRYEAGVGTSIEVTDAQTRLARARDNRIAALFQHNLAKIELASAMGVIYKVIQ